MLICSVVYNFATPGTVAHQASLSVEFSTQQSWSELWFLPPGDLPTQRSSPASFVSSTGGWVLFHRATGKPVSLHHRNSFQVPVTQLQALCRGFPKVCSSISHVTSLSGKRQRSSSHPAASGNWTLLCHSHLKRSLFFHEARSPNSNTLLGLLCTVPGSVSLFPHRYHPGRASYR